MDVLEVEVQLSQRLDRLGAPRVWAGGDLLAAVGRLGNDVLLDVLLPLVSGEELLQSRGGSEARVSETPEAEPRSGEGLGVAEGVALEGESVEVRQVTLAVAGPAGLAGEPLPVGAQEEKLGESRGGAADLGYEVPLVAAVDVSPAFVGWSPTPQSSQRIVSANGEKSRHLLVPVRVSRAMTLLRLQARSVLDLELGSIERDKVLQNGPPSFATNWSNGEHRLGEALADGHQMANARERGAVVAYVVGVRGSERVTGLLVAIPLESVELSHWLYKEESPCGVD